ncbi:MAG: hypothetical protein AAGJ31_01475 [Verrucomicrobiota bacterium]
MRRFILFFTFLLLPLLPSLASEEGLLVGTAKVDISPTETPFQLRSGPSHFVHDPLHVQAIALQQGEGKVVLALMDAIGVGRDMCDAAKAEVAAETGWPVEAMLVSGTHTHTAPKGGDSTPGRIAYETRRKEGLTNALTMAIQALAPAQIGFASDEESSEVRNRRWFQKPGTLTRKNPLGDLDQVLTNGGKRENLLRPAGPVDPEVAVIDIRSRNNARPLALLANYALHYVGGIPKVRTEESREVGMASADYFGEFSRVVPFRLGGRNPPENFVALMTNGASGDINNLPHHLTRAPRAPFEQVRIVASKTADAAWRAVEKIESYDSNPLIATLQREVFLEYRRPSAAEIEKAEALLNLTRREQSQINARTPSNVTKVMTYAGTDRPPAEGVLVQAIRLGDQAIVSLPFEVFVEIGLEIKEKSPFPHTMLIALANGGYGYLPTPEQHKLGGYETWISSARFETNASDQLTDELLEMLGELHALPAQ